MFNTIRVYQTDPDRVGTYLRIEAIKSVDAGEDWVAVISLKDSNSKSFRIRLRGEQLTKVRHFIRDVEDEFN